MINREDMLELTRRMTPSRTCFQRIAGCYMDREGCIDNTFNVNFLKMSGAEKAKHLSLAKEVPFSRTNDQLREYRFARNAMGGGSMYQLLTGIHACGLKNDLLMEVLYEQIGAAYRTDTDYAVHIFHGVYDIPVKAADKERLGESEEIYDFIICTISPLLEEYEPGKPDFGFLFPAFSGRSAMPDGIDIFNRNPEAPQADLMALILGSRVSA